MRSKHTLFFIFYVVICLCVVEAVLRIFRYPYIGCTSIDEVSEYQIGQYDPVLGWSYAHPRSTTLWDEKIYSFNADGYRVDAVGDKIDSSKPNILLIGDSFLFGHGLNFKETFGYKLQEKLGNSYNVINFAVQGYGLDQAYLQLQRVMPIYAPRYVIIDLHEDQDYRNANWDRRSMFPCSHMAGTKPMYSVRDRKLLLVHTPERFETYDSPRIKLLWNRIADSLNQKYTDKVELSAYLYRAVRSYTEEHGARLFEINYLLGIREYQMHPVTASASAIVVDYGRGYDNDGVHPNDRATTRMVDEFMAVLGDQLQ